jgi:hypothetical protein
MGAGYALLALAAGLLPAGCSSKGDDKDGGGSSGPQTAEVSGTVTLPDGKPLPAGWIAFHGRAATETTLAPIDNGKFTAKGVPPGPVRVTIDVTSIADQAQDVELRLREAQTRAGLMKQAGSTQDMSARIAELQEQKTKLDALRKALQGVKVDEKYLQAETTPLAYTIAGPSQTISVTLK